MGESPDSPTDPSLFPGDLRKERMSRNYILWLSILIFGTLSASALAVPILSNTSANGTGVADCGGFIPFEFCSRAFSISGLETESVQISAEIDVASPGPPVSGASGLGVDMLTEGPVAPGVLDISWSGGFGDFAGCCFTASNFGGSVWDLETGTPVLVYSWSSPGGFGAGGVTLPFKLGIPFSVSVGASLSAEWTDPERNFAPSGYVQSMAVVGVRGIPEPGSFAFMLVGLGAAGVQTALRYRRNRP
jgi:hypothetical protein